MISLVTTLKNEATTVEDLIAAVRAQTRPTDEWIVVDGGSGDGTAERLAASGVCRVIVLPDSNISAGRNRAIEAASGDIIAVIDGGCRPAPNWLARLVGPVETGRADIAAGPTRPIIETPFDAAQWVLLDQFVSPITPRRAALSSRSLAFRREVWADCKYPEWLAIGEDRWLIDAWRARGRRIETLPDDASLAVNWRMRPTPRAFVVQHFRYMRGDGQAGLRTKTNLARLAFYLLIVVSLAFGARGAGFALLAWLIYLLATVLTRIVPATRNRPVAFLAKTLLFLPPALLAMDLAKIFGYLLGWFQHPRGNGHR
ncbi:glycosyltransferase [bacterium]|nr:glycosyltransferase [bacterium]